MNLSARTEYACLAMLQLAAEHGTADPVQIRRIAEEQGIPARFLVQILLQLKGAGLVVSTRGAAGGYRLARAPREITVAEIIDAIEGDERPRTNAGKMTPLVGILLDFCNDVRETQRERLSETTLAQLVEQAAMHEPMWYI